MTGGASMRRMAFGLLAACLVSWVIGAHAQDCSDIRGKICSLTKFEPDPGSGSSNAKDSPACDKPDTATDTQKDWIQSAFDLAPIKVKNDLCKLTSIFVATDRASWGRWEDPANHNNATPGKTEIAISSSDIGKTFSAKQDDNLKMITGKATAKHSEDLAGGRVAPEIIGLLYVLAHELGHVRWHRDLGVGDGIGCADDPNFYSWKDVTNAKSNRWTKFGNDLGDHRRAKVKKPKDIGNDDDLRGIYFGGFATALGATNPEEDFVESYAIRILMEACPECIFNVTIGSGSSAATIKVNDAGGNPDLKAKLNCVYDKYIKS